MVINLTKLATLKKAINIARHSKTLAIAEKTFVGVCIVTNKGFYGGANFENSYKKVYHAEETALIRSLYDGNRGTEFLYMVQLAFAKDKIYPCCLSCLAFLWEYTHPDFHIYTVWEGEVVHSASLAQLTSGFIDADIYPKK